MAAYFREYRKMIDEIEKDAEVRMKKTVECATKTGVRELCCDAALKLPMAKELLKPKVNRFDSLGKSCSTVALALDARKWLPGWYGRTTAQ